VSEHDLKVLQAMASRTAFDPSADPTMGADLGAGKVKQV
jgi:Mn-containing catalase